MALLRACHIHMLPRQRTDWICSRTVLHKRDEQQVGATPHQEI